MQRYVVKRDVLDRVRQNAVAFTAPAHGRETCPFLSGQLLGGFAEPFHCFQILPHGFHGKRVRLLSGDQLVDFRCHAFG